MDNVRKQFEEVALEGCKAVKAFLAYQGSNKDYFHKAKAGAVAMGSYARLRATMANERALELATIKQLQGQASQILAKAYEDDPKQLGEGDGAGN